ncbi:MAG: glycosyltransferase [Candidatus Moranbacteria bacterium]|nr:glycosyltransferase [Candidatus Moranbacteria bacterium]
MWISSEEYVDPEYSLITVNYQSAFLIGRLFRSLPPDFALKGELIIVNNDVEESRLLQRMFQERSSINIIEMEDNLGFSVACNRGAAVARGKVLFFLNPDTELPPVPLEGWFRDYIGSGKTILAPKLIQNGQEEPWSSGGLVSPWRILMQNIFPFPRFWSFFPRKSLAWVSGAALALKKKDFISLGGFDEGYFLYYEDVDLCRRAIERGFRIRKSDEVSCIHYGGRSHSEGAKKQKQAYFDSQDRYIQRYYGPLWCSFLRLLRALRFSFSRILC